MLPYIKNILQSTTGKSSLQDVSVEQLQQLTETHPYFTAANFLLAKKMLADGSENFNKAAQKTALHFDNALLLHFNFFEEVNSVEIGEYLVTENNINAAVDADVLPDNDKQKESNLLQLHQQDEEDELLEGEDASIENTPESISFESNEKLSLLLKEQAEAFEKPAAETPLIIEAIPSHRIDYFESQGIKLDLEKDADDKLGRQLKKFTDWLKQMKRVNPDLNNNEPDMAGEIKAQNMAARSNEQNEVVTETMAEVFIKQDKLQEAINIYEKLSFFNPSKSAYFAAKIQELKAKQ